jgi:hypothetical protein
VRVSTVRHHAGDRPASFLADFLGNCAIAFAICPLMRQKSAFRYFGPSIDEVIVLRKAKRLASNVRSEFSTFAGRQRAAPTYVKFLENNPLRLECFERFIWHLNDCFPAQQEDAEDVVLGRGYF